MPNVDPDKNPIRQILEDSQESSPFADSDRNVFEAIASYHNVPYLANSKPELWDPKVAADIEDEDFEPTDEEIEAIQREGIEGPIDLRDPNLPTAIPKYKIPNALDVDKEGVPIERQIVDVEGVRPQSGPAAEESLQGGEKTGFSFTNIEQGDNGSFTLNMSNGGAVDIQVDSSGTIASVDGFSPDQANMLDPYQLAAVAVIAERSKGQAARTKNFGDVVSPGEFGTALNAIREQNPEFDSQIKSILRHGLTTNRGITESVEAEQTFEQFVDSQLAVENNPQFGMNYAEIAQKAQAGDKNALQFIINLKKIYDRKMDADSTETSSETAQVRNLASRTADITTQPVVNPVPLAEEPGYPEETIDEALEGAPSAVGYGETKEAAGEKKDHPSPKAAEEVFKALEGDDHEAAHHWMKQTDCPMGCETNNNEGVCRHGYMSAGRTRVVFLDKDLRRANVHEADWFKSLENFVSPPFVALDNAATDAWNGISHGISEGVQGLLPQNSPMMDAQYKAEQEAKRLQQRNHDQQLYDKVGIPNVNGMPVPTLPGYDQNGNPLPQK